MNKEDSQTELDDLKKQVRERESDQDLDFQGFPGLMHCMPIS